jgi:putative aminopeptidase FrvX
MRRTPRKAATNGRPSARQLDSLLARLVAARAPAGQEEDVRAILAESLLRGQTISGTPLGSLHVDLGPSGPRRLLLAAAMDEPSLIVSAIDKDGRARLKALGPVEPASLIGHRVRFRNGALGVIARVSGDEAHNPAGLGDLMVDFGVADRDDCQVGPADVGTIESSLEAIGACLVGRSVASRALLTILAGIASRTAAPKLPLTIGYLAHGSIEDRGLGPTATAVAPQQAILLRPVWAGSESGVDLGGGPVLGVPSVTDATSRDFVAWLKESARRSGVTVQERLLPANDRALGILQGSALGIAAATLELPAANLNTPGEMIRRADLLALQDLLLHILRSADKR